MSRTLGELHLGDRLICLRIRDNIAVYKILTVTAIQAESNTVLVESDDLDRYSFSFSRYFNNKIDGLKIILDSGRDIDDLLEEYLFEDILSCKNFTKQYFQNKIHSYEKTIQRIEAW